MKTVYSWDNQKIFKSTKLVNDDYILNTNETFTALPQPNLMPITWTGASWQSATPEEHAAYLQKSQEEFLRQHPELNQPTEQSKSDQTINLLGQQIAKVQATQATMAQSINALGQLVVKAQTPAAQQPTEPAQSGNQATEPQA